MTYVAMVAVAIWLEKRHRLPKIDPEVVKKMFWSEMRDYRNRLRKKGVFGEKKDDKIKAMLFGASKTTLKKEANKPQSDDVKDKCILPVYLGKDKAGNEHVVDLQQLPHFLVSGKSGGGKTKFMQSLINSLLKTAGEKITIKIGDKKRIDFKKFAKAKEVIRVTSESDIIGMVEGAGVEMEDRYKMMEEIDTEEGEVENIADYNAINEVKMKYQVLVLDEIGSICRDKTNKHFLKTLIKIAEMGRAAGIHLVLCTQQPTVENVPGGILANISARIAFKVATAKESFIALGRREMGAENITKPGEFIYVDGDKQVRGRTKFVQKKT